MPKPEDNKRPNPAPHPDRGETPKSGDFRTFAETVVEFGRLIKQSPSLGFDDLKNLISDDSEKGKEKT